KPGLLFIRLDNLLLLLTIQVIMVMLNMVSNISNKVFLIHTTKTHIISNSMVNVHSLQDLTISNIFQIIQDINIYRPIQEANRKNIVHNLNRPIVSKIALRQFQDIVQKIPL